MNRHPMRIAVLAMLVVGGASAGHATVIATNALQMDEAVGVAAAVRFRTEFGLRNDGDFVLSTFADSNYVATEWGVPLSTAELADLAERTVQRELLEPAVERAGSLAGGAGVYLDQTRGGIAVFNTTDPTTLNAELARLVPEGTRYEVRMVDRSLAELVATQNAVIDSIASLAGEGITISAVELDVRRNAVTVAVDGLTDQAIRIITDRADAGSLIFSDRPPGNLDTCSSMVYCWPMKGGIRAYLVSDSGLICTTGFNARTDASHSLVALTAGHCLALNNSSGVDYWGHAATPTGAENFGQERAHTYFDYTVGDIGLLTLDSTTVAAMAGVMQKVHTTDPGTNEDVQGVRANASQLLGDSVCRMGWGTWNAYGQGKTCGTITVLDATKLTHGVHIMHVKVVSFDSILGDSGGPIWHKVFTPEPYLVAYGTHSGSDDEHDVEDPVGWYSAIDKSNYQYTSTFGSGFTLCTTSNC